MSCSSSRLYCWLPLPALIVGFSGIVRAEVGTEADSSTPVLFEKSDLEEFVLENCASCHDAESRKGGLAIDEILPGEVAEHASAWEKVIRKLSTRQMPPPDEPRPDEDSYDAIVSWLASELDAAASRGPHPGRTETFRRLNRTEYQNAIRDLLALEIDVGGLLPADESSHGFDNVTVADLPPTLLSRYVTAAQKISRLAVGTT